VFYYKNGKKREEGTWKNNRWTGDYKYYYENGNIRNEWKYNNSGKRTGVQKYYHENGQLMIEGKWNNGQEAGTIVEYYDDGSVKSERVFNNGKINKAITKNFKPKEKAGKVTVRKVKKYVAPEVVAKEKKIVKKEAVAKTEAPWNGTGTKSFLNKRGQVVRKGYFEKGYLMNGEVYMYTADGKKFRTTVYKDGRVIKVENHQEESAAN
jgi:antitoxin component YwqK of YwqJK toxin-antitoxin module